MPDDLLLTEESEVCRILLFAEAGLTLEEYRAYREMLEQIHEQPKH